MLGDGGPLRVWFRLHTHQNTLGGKTRGLPLSYCREVVQRIWFLVHMSRAYVPYHLLALLHCSYGVIEPISEALYLTLPNPT
jgi:hypothetical protein